MLEQIIKKVNESKNNKLGIAIKDNTNDCWACKFTSLSEMKSLGFETVEDYLNHISEKGYPDITVYLKRSNGSSSVYVDNHEVRLKSKLKTNNEPTTALTTTNTNNNTMQANENNGMLGGMNMQVMDMYSKSVQFEDAKRKVAKLELEAINKDTEIKRLERENMNLSNQITMNSKPVISDSVASIFATILPELGDKIINRKGLNGSQQQHQQQAPLEHYSEAKTKLLNYIKNDGIDDSYCTIVHRVLDKLYSDEAFLDVLIKQLTNKQTHATN
ncbi:hypothetical protein [Aurantibacter aestuarii]|uniref:Uncharacterized protein n=1 Tax=Aurantibacter aestuarii TaxID=1266046 RepID=A0A2T1NEQ0_9FLAO|nr:hypothetical protein [Aurantibacter aestuarii]PSG90879.1 hypothetical protein C7H52_06290 [Aurantibacter aestuarii]